MNPLAIVSNGLLAPATETEVILRQPSSITSVEIKRISLEVSTKSSNIDVKSVKRAEVGASTNDTNIQASVNRHDVQHR